MKNNNSNNLRCKIVNFSTRLRSASLIRGISWTLEWMPRVILVNTVDVFIARRDARTVVVVDKLRVARQAIRRVNC